MVQDAEKYRQDDEGVRDKVQAKNALESYAYNLRNTLNDDKLKIPEDDKAKLEKAVNDTVHWLESHAEEEKDVYEKRQKEMEAVCAPIITRAYQAAGGAPPTGGAPAPGQSEPEISEELD